MKFSSLFLLLFSFSILSTSAQVGKRDIKAGDCEKAELKADNKVKAARERRAKVGTGFFNQPLPKTDDSLLGHDLLDAAESYYFCGKFEKARPLLEEGIEIFTRLEDKAISLDSYASKLADTYAEVGEFFKADSLLDQIVKRADLVPISMSEELDNRAWKYDEIAAIYQRIGKLDKAGRIYEDQISFYGERYDKKKRNTVAKALLNTSDSYVSSRFEGACRDALEFYSETAQYAKAENVAAKFLEYGQIKYGVDNKYYCGVIGEKAELLIEMGQYQNALDLFRECERLVNFVSGEKQNVGEAYLTAFIGQAYLGLQNYSEAERHFREALKWVTEKTSLRSERVDVFASIGLSSALNKQGRHDEALKTAKRMLTEYDRLSVMIRKFGERRGDLRNLTGLYTCIGLAYQGLKKYDSAKYFLEQTLVKQAGFPQYRAKTALLMAELNVETGNHTEAAAFYKQSIDEWLLFWTNNQFVLSEDGRGEFFNAISSAVNSFNSYATSRVKENPALTGDVYNYQLATKGVLLNSSQKVRLRIQNSGDVGLIRKFDDWQNERKVLTTAYQMTQPELDARGIDIKKLEAAIDAHEKELSQLSQLFVPDTDKNRYTWQDVQKKLKPTEASLEIVRIQKPVHRDSIHYAAIILKSGTVAPEMVVMTKGRMMETRGVTYYRNALMTKVADALSYGVFWAPFSKKLTGIKRVYVTPDGIYNQVNASILQNPVSKKNLIDEVDVRWLTNSSEIIAISPKSSKPGNVTLFGYPDFSNSGQKLIMDSSRSFVLAAEKDSLRSFFGGKIPELPGTRDEIVSVSKVLTAQHVTAKQFMGEAAIEDAVKEVVDPETLHFATHGYFLSDDLLVSNSTFMGFDQSVISRNPLLRSGLLLAGSQKTFDGFISPGNEDGVLTAQEAMALNLEKTNLVILSACETGLGKIRNGEGVYGLQRAFLKAGAQAVLMSLWKVDDQATQQLMTLFYQSWLKTGNKRDALQQAQKAVRAKYPHPYYWGAFVMVGE